MKIIEKTCPNCGANIDFNKGDTKVKCEYCKKTYVIEEDKEDIALVEMKTFSRLFMVIFFIAFIFIAFVGVMMFNAIGNQTKGLPNNKEEVKEIKSFDDISSDTIDKIHKKSAEMLSSPSSITINEQKEPYKNVGMYLVIYDGGYTIYDVYKSVYDVKGTEKDVYTAIEYNDISNMYGIPVTNSNVKSDLFMLGYESVEDLYNNVINKVEYKDIYSTNGLYIKK